MALLCLAATGWAADSTVRWQLAPTVVEGSGPLTNFLQITPPPDTAVTVGWKTNQESAVPGRDYVETSGTIVIPAGTVRTPVTVSIINDNFNSGTRTFGMQITSVTGGGNWGSPNYVSATITDDDTSAPPATPPAVAWAPASTTVPSGSGPTAFNLALANAWTQPISVQWQTNAQSAVPGSDYATAGGTIVFAPGETAKPATVNILSGAIAGRTFGLQITTITGGAWGTPNYQAITITAPLVPVATPVITPAAGTYQQDVTATASSTTVGAVLRYRLDGTAPAATDPLLPAAGLSISTPATLAVRGFADGSSPSATATAAYAFTAAPVTADLAAGTYTGARSVTLSTASVGADIRYTLDGSAPTAASALATGPIDLPGSCTLKAQAMRTGWTSSAVFSAVYKLRVATPALTPAPGTYTTPQTVSATAADAQAVLRYTTDGTNPTAASTLWPTDGLAVTQTTPLRVAAFRSGWLDSAVRTGTYTLRVARITADPRGGTYIGARSVVLSTTTPGAIIRYTVDGSVPDGTSLIASGPIVLKGTTTLRALASRTGWSDSAAFKTTYTLQVDPVVADLASGTYVGPRSVTLTCATAGAEIRYTLDGSVPGAGSLLVSGPVVLPGTCSLKAVAMLTGWKNSATLSRSYTLQVEPVVPSKPAGTYIGEQIVTLATAAVGAQIHYTLDGKTPTAASPVASGPITISGNRTLRAIAMLSGWRNSATLSVAYLLRVPEPAISPAGGAYGAWPKVTASASDPLSTVRYTRGATPPTASSPVFPAAGIQLSGPDTVNMVATRTGWTISLPVSAIYTANVPPVTAGLDLSGTEDTAIVGQAAASDPDGQVLTWNLLAAPQHGSVDLDQATGRFTYQPSANWNGSDTFVLVVSDGIATAQAPVSVLVLAVNDAPVAAALAVSGNEDEAIAIQGSASDVDGDTLAWAVLTQPQHGTLTLVDAATGSFSYAPAGNWNGSDSLVLTVSDASVTVEVPVTITVAAVNDPPQLAGIESALIWYRDGDAALAATAALTISDIDSTGLSGASVRIAGNFEAGDVLQFANQNGIVGAWNAGSGILTLSGNATLANYQTALRTVKYRSPQAFPGTAARTIAFRVSDGSSSNEVARTIAVVTRSAPAWSEGFEGLPAGGDLHQLEQQGLTRWHAWNAAPGASAPVSAAQARSGGVSVAIAGAADLVHEYKGVNAGGWRYSAWQFIPNDFAGTTYFILLNTYRDTTGTDGKNWSTQVKFSGSQVLPDFAGGSAPLVKGAWVELHVDVDFAANLQRFTYNGTQVFERSWTGGTTGGGVLNLAAVDLYGNGASAVYYDDISLTPIVPTISGGGSVAYVENAVPVVVMPALAVDGFGVAQLTGAVVQLSGDLAQDSLSASVSGGISQSWNPATGTLTFSGTATPAAYEAVLRTVAFANASDAPSLAPRTVAVAVAAPSGTSNTVSATVTVTAVNDAPVAVAQSLSGDEDTTLVGQASASDVDGDALTWSLQSDGQFGHATVSASGAISYVPTANRNGTDSITLAVTDSHVTVELVVPVVVQAVDDPAVIAGPTSGAVAPDSDLRLTGFTLSDIDSPTISLNLTVGAGSITLPGLAASGAEVTSGTGSWDSALAIQGSAAAINAAVSEIVWRSPASAGATTLVLEGNGGAWTVALQALPQVVPIAIRAMASSAWNDQPHGVRLLPSPARFWNIEVAVAGAYHLWVNGSSANPIQIELDGVASGAIAMPAGWNCTNATGAVQTLQLATGVHRLALVGQPTSLDGLILVSAVAEAVADRQPLLAGPGAVTVIDPKAYDAVEMNTGHSWLPGPNGGLQALPDVEHYDQVGTLANRGLSYAVYFAQPGTYVAWIRAQGPPTGDSLIVALDGAKPATYVTNFPNGTPGWKNKYMNGAVVTLVVATSGIHMVDVRWREDGVELTQIAISGVGAWYPLETMVVEPSARPGIVTTDSQGRAVFEAEIAQRQPSQTGQVWEETAMVGAVGSVMAAGTDQGYTYSADIRTAGAVCYVRFPAAGTYDLWVRGFAPDWSGDTYFLGLAGAQAQTMTLNKVGAFAWAKVPMGTSTGTVTVSSPGVWPVNLWMREDGFRLDRVIIQPVGAPAPTDTPAIPASPILPVFSSDG